MGGGMSMGGDQQTGGRKEGKKILSSLANKVSVCVRWMKRIKVNKLSINCIKTENRKKSKLTIINTQKKGKNKSRESPWNFVQIFRKICSFIIFGKCNLSMNSYIRLSDGCRDG